MQATNADTFVGPPTHHEEWWGSAELDFPPSYRVPIRCQITYSVWFRERRRSVRRIIPHQMILGYRRDTTSVTFSLQGTDQGYLRASTPMADDPYDYHPVVGLMPKPFFFGGMSAVVPQFIFGRDVTYGGHAYMASTFRHRDEHPLSNVPTPQFVNKYCRGKAGLQTAWMTSRWGHYADRLSRNITSSIRPPVRPLYHTRPRARRRRACHGPDATDVIKRTVDLRL